MHPLAELQLVSLRVWSHPLVQVILVAAVLFFLVLIPVEVVDLVIQPLLLKQGILLPLNLLVFLLGRLPLQTNLPVYRATHLLVVWVQLDDLLLLRLLLVVVYHQYADLL